MRDLSRFVEFSKKIIGLARNYRPRQDAVPSPVMTEFPAPFLFMKPTSSYITPGQNIEIPSPSAYLIHEVELGVVIGREGRNLSERDALDHVGGYVLALDMTDKHETQIAMATGMPWIYAKCFDTATPVSDFIPRSLVSNPDNVSLWLSVNGDVRQQGNTSDMVYSVPRIISWISQRFRLQPGDLILTGTPDGGAQVVAGDTITCGLSGIMEMTFKVQGHPS